MKYGMSMNLNKEHFNIVLALYADNFIIIKLSAYKALYIRYLKSTYNYRCFFNILYIKMKWFFVCLYISEAVSTELRTRLPLCLQEVVGYVWAHNVTPHGTFPTFSGSFLTSGCRVLRRRWLPASGSFPKALYP